MLIEVPTNGISNINAISRPQEWLNRSWTGQIGRVEQFLRARPGRVSPLEELVGEKITKTIPCFTFVDGKEQLMVLWIILETMSL